MTTWDLRGMHHLVLLCNGGCCSERGADAVTLAVRDEIRARGLEGRVHTARTRCLGRCDDGCTVVVAEGGAWYARMTPESARAMVRVHLEGGTPLASHLAYRASAEGLAKVGDGPEGRRLGSGGGGAPPRG